MILLVNDASILIDLLKLDLIEKFFELNCIFYITDFVLAEIQEENVAKLHQYVQTKKLKKKTFDFKELYEIQLLEIKHKALSIPDCSCLFFAKTLSANLLTADGALRKIANQHNITVHGILWILDEMVKTNIISSKTACKKLKTLMSINLRLPQKECTKRLSKWGND